MHTVYINHEVTQTEDGRFASTISINNAISKTRYYEHRTFMYVAIRGLLNVLNSLPDGATVQLNSNIFNLHKVLDPDYDYPMKTRQYLLAEIEKKELKIELQ